MILSFLIIMIEWASDWFFLNAKWEIVLAMLRWEQVAFWWDDVDQHD